MLEKRGQEGEVFAECVKEGRCDLLRIQRRVLLWLIDHSITNGRNDVVIE